MVDTNFIPRLRNPDCVSYQKDVLSTVEAVMSLVGRFGYNETYTRTPVPRLVEYSSGVRSNGLPTPTFRPGPLSDTCPSPTSQNDRGISPEVWITFLIPNGTLSP